MARLHGRSPRGERAHASVPCGTWKRVSVLGAIGSAGMIAALSLDAATDSASFVAYLEQVLLPELQTVKPDAVLVLEQPAPAQDGRGAGRARGFWVRLSLPAALQPGSEPDRARLGQVQVRVARGRCAHGRRPACSDRSGTRRHHRTRCRRLLPALRV